MEFQSRVELPSFMESQSNIQHPPCRRIQIQSLSPSAARTQYPVEAPVPIRVSVLQQPAFSSQPSAASLQQPAFSSQPPAASPQPSASSQQTAASLQPSAFSRQQTRCYHHGKNLQKGKTPSRSISHTSQVERRRDSERHRRVSCSSSEHQGQAELMAGPDVGRGGAGRSVGWGGFG
ncbi:uncharacterized protein LOC121858417 [Homarus americanus]|uniref:uncharacterized protein LOC121858417 n=1 Tax=Homarus americanus TaxID=6706 RepID=UPI001C496B41|nr:uncharacterized protein LOC121858417 [Homarus americanus]